MFSTVQRSALVIELLYSIGIAFELHIHRLVGSLMKSVGGDCKGIGTTKTAC